MSVETVKKFMQEISKDETLAEKVKEAGTDVNAVISLGKEKDCEFTAQDLKDFHDELGKADEELSDEDLEKVAGGFVTATAAAVVGAVAGSVAAGAAVAGAAAGVASAGVAVATAVDAVK